MKKIFLNALLIVLTACVSCRDENLMRPSFQVRVDTENAVADNDENVPVFKKGSPVRFIFDGVADHVTFYSGEPGMMYKNKDRTKLQGRPFMQFNTQMDGGVMPPDVLSVLLSTDFAGITNDPAIDRQHISEATWTDVTADSHIPTTETTQLSPEIDLSAYTDQSLYVAFRYTRPANQGDYPRYQIKNFRINNEADGMAYGIMTTGTAGWTAFDFNVPADEDPYVSTGGGAPNRFWDLRNAVADDRIYIGYNSNTDNDDWAITTAIDLSSISPDIGEGIKAYDDDRLREFQYIFNNTGTFTVSFLATNSRYSDAETVLREVTIRVTD